MKLLAFNFTEANHPVRTTTIDSQPWFVAADVCRILGIRNHRDAIGGLEKEERASANTDTLGGPQDMAIINESGLYTLIFKSRKPVARRFRVWVTSEVLPAIREHGYYSVFGSDADVDAKRLECRVAGQMSHIRSSVENLAEPLPGTYASITAHLNTLGVDLSDDPGQRIRLYTAVRSLARKRNIHVIPVWSANSWRAVNHYPLDVVKDAISGMDGISIAPDLFDYIDQPTR